MTGTTRDGGSGRFSRLAVPAPESLDPGLRQRIDASGGDRWLRAMSLSPKALERFLTCYTDLMHGRDARLTPAERELVGVVVSATNGRGCCEMNHLRGLARALKDPVRARRSATDWHTAGLTAREAGIVAVALDITRDPHRVSDAGVQGLRDLGLDDEEILEVIEMASWFNHSNRIAIAMGLVPDDKFFAADWVG